MFHFNVFLKKVQSRPPFVYFRLFHITQYYFRLFYSTQIKYKLMKV